MLNLENAQYALYYTKVGSLYCVTIFTDVVQPICLPINQALNEPLNEKYLTIAGYGFKQMGNVNIMTNDNLSE